MRSGDVEELAIEIFAFEVVTSACAAEFRGFATGWATWFDANRLHGRATIGDKGDFATPAARPDRTV